MARAVCAAAPPSTSPLGFGVRDSGFATPDLCDDVDMTLEEFKATFSASVPPSVPKTLQALWHDARGEWDKAHEIANDVDDKTGAWVHAYLHRKEGDVGNAAYWYRRAEQPVASDSLESEWTRIVSALIK
jgi:hypothetical protein